MSAKLSGKVAVVTGASSGIGKATALALAAEGAKVAIAARRSDRLELVAKQIEQLGSQALPIVADITDEAQANHIIQTAHAEFGQIDILINNAGIALLGKIAHADTSDWRRMIELNVLGLMWTTHAVLPIFTAQKSGHVVNISSVAGRTIRVGIGVYNVTKWGVNAFSEALRQEVCKENIRVTVIEPGLVDTEINDHITDVEAKQAIEARRKSLTPLQSEDIAGAVIYAVTQPKHVNVNEILIRPTEQEQ